MTPSREDQTKILELFTQIVDSVARLFETYSQILPEYHGFWFGMAMGEIDHSNLIHECLGSIRKGSFQVSTGGFDIKLMENLLDYIQRETDRASHHKIEMNEALLTALHIERTVIERQYLDFLSDYCRNVSHPSANRARTAWNHAKAIEMFYEKLVGKPPS